MTTSAASLARSLRRTVHEALHPAPRRVGFALVRRGALIDAADAIDILVKRLHSPEPIAAEGAALIERMLSDGAWSPLYSAAPAGALRRLVVLATAALEPAALAPPRAGRPGQLTDTVRPAMPSPPEPPPPPPPRWRFLREFVESLRDLSSIGKAVHVRQPASDRPLPPARQAQLTSDATERAPAGHRVCAPEYA